MVTRTQMQQDNKLQKIKELREKMENYEAMFINKIKEDLAKKTYPGSKRYLFTYKDIAKKYDISVSKVQRIALENNLARKTQE